LLQNTKYKETSGGFLQLNRNLWWLAGWLAKPS